MKSLKPVAKATGPSAEPDKRRHIQGAAPRVQLPHCPPLRHWTDSEWECRIREQIEGYAKSH
jgi:hypothetical protein